MKPFEIIMQTNITPANDVAAAAPEPNAALKQRLWELLLPMPEAAPAQVSSSVTTRPSSADAQHTRSDSRDNTQSSELLTTAYLLASHVQQLTLWDATLATTRPRDASSSASEPAYTVQLESAADGGGRASVELSHPELGAVGLAVELSGGAVRVTATTTSERGGQLIAEGQAILAERLARQGVVLEALDVIVTPNRKRRRPSARARARREES